ncbi:hypothetical protein J3E69DRAFT_340144 [Trichoderma sp. SZMC 28015]
MVYHELLPSELQPSWQKSHTNVIPVKREIASLSSIKIGMASPILPVLHSCQRPGTMKIAKSGTHPLRPVPRIPISTAPDRRQPLIPTRASPIPVPEGSCPKKGNKTHVEPG